MPETDPSPSYARPGFARRRSVLSDEAPPRNRYGLHLLLFVATFIACVYAGGFSAARDVLWAQYPGWIYLNPVVLRDGVVYAVGLLLFLTVHEFGHYFAARYHRVNTSLPYYIPFPIQLPGLFNIGTFGAVIRIREAIPSLRKLFDIGAAGPLAGFVVALGVLGYALATLPDPTYLLDLSGHEALNAHIRQYGTFPDIAPSPGALVVGQTPLFWLLTQAFPNVPPMYELYHYPLLFAGWLGLFFTALNLLPVGQLDGGHILYALAGPRKHSILARVFVGLLLLSASIGWVQTGGLMLGGFSWLAGSPFLLKAVQWLVLSFLLYYFLSKLFAGQMRYVGPGMVAVAVMAIAAQYVGEPLLQFGYYGWFLWCWLIVRFIKVDHPPVLVRQPLTPGRKALGWLALAIFVLCFSFKPLYVA